MVLHVCHSVHMGWVSAPEHAGIHPPGQTPPSWADTPQANTYPPLGRHSPGRNPPPRPVYAGIHTPLPSAFWDTLPPVHAGIHMATAAGGRHPTGMRSFISFFSVEYCGWAWILYTCF